LQTLSLEVADVSAWISRLWWPMLRIGGFVATAPLMSSAVVPPRVKIVLNLALGALLAPLAQVPADLSVFSGRGVVAACQELVTGLAIGTVVQLAFESVTLAGQVISMTMGLGFATLVDPERGANTAVLGQFLMIIAVLGYLAVNGHLVLIGALAHSFHTLPVGGAHVDANLFWSMARWGAQVFETGLLIALPAVVALIIVNLALGVVTRAAPQLNIFGIGFPITLLAGFFVLFVGIDAIMLGMSDLVDDALLAVSQLVASPAVSAR